MPQAGQGERFDGSLTPRRYHTLVSSGGSNEVLAAVSLEASSDPDLEEGAVLEMEFGSGSGRVEF